MTGITLQFLNCWFWYRDATLSLWPCVIKAPKPPHEIMKFYTTVVGSCHPQLLFSASVYIYQQEYLHITKPLFKTHIKNTFPAIDKA